MVSMKILSLCHQSKLTVLAQLARLLGLAMLTAATAIFLYYTVWTLLMVVLQSLRHSLVLTMVLL
jgi:hypothetical protein